MKRVSNFFTSLFRRCFQHKAVVILFPYTWMILFFFIPFLFIFKISLSELSIGIPPYKAIMERVSEDALLIKVHFGNYLYLLWDDLYILAYINSLIIAGLATICCLLIGFPMAYGISRCSKRAQTWLMMMVILPFWTSFLIRIYAWIGLLSRQGVINNLLIHFGLIDEPIQILSTNFAVSIGIVYCYLPFMIIPIYVSLQKIDISLLEAAYDLGCRPRQVFWKVTVPLAISGIVSGSLLVFIPAMGEFVIPDLLGGADTLMIGRVMWNEFFVNRDWPVACALAVATLVVLVLPIVLFQHLQKDPYEGEV